MIESWRLRGSDLGQRQLQCRIVVTVGSGAVVALVVGKCVGSEQW